MRKMIDGLRMGGNDGIIGRFPETSDSPWGPERSGILRR